MMVGLFRHFPTHDDEDGRSEKCVCVCVCVCDAVDITSFDDVSRLARGDRDTTTCSVVVK